MELIVTEKDNAARRIAAVLSGDAYDAERRGGVNVYAFGGRRVVGLSGHVVGVDFPEEYDDWRDVEPVELADAPIVRTVTREDIVGTLRSLAREADSVIIATDYDREGELIGKEAYELVREETDAPIRRVRFSSITEREVREAFDDPGDLDFDLAAAGEARQTIDLVWGAALTRFLSLTARQLGNDFISVGRVQSPTLKLIVDREREIEAFEPEDYWEIFADLVAGENGGERFEAQYFYLDDGREAERVTSEADAEAAFETLQGAPTATVEEVRRRTRTDEPPAPFNTTAFIKAAGSLGYAASRAMDVAESLYTAGYVTYPRTDNTVYPEDLEERDLLERLGEHPNYGEDAERLLEQGDIEPTSGDKQTTDHPPIHPTGEFPEELSDDEWEIYELIVRRFYATCAPGARWAHLRVTADAGGVKLKANGKRLLEPGYHAVYPYSSADETAVPAVEEGDELAVEEPRLEAKQTQPPRRYGQSRLIERMEGMGVGTKCLTGNSEVLVREDGDVSRRQVGDLFDNESVVMADGDTDIAVTEDGPVTLSFDEESERLVERDATLVSRRPLEDGERVLELQTEAGTVSVTDEHPVYVSDNGRPRVAPARDIEPGDRLLAARRPPSTVANHLAGGSEEDGPVLGWEEFAESCDWTAMLFGVDCGEDLRDYRDRRGESQADLAERIGAHRAKIAKCELGRADVPVWILGEIGVRPDELHGQNYDFVFENPLPLEWSPELARLVANVLGDGSVHRDEDENVVDVRYHNTDRRLIDRFVEDCRSVFGIEPRVSEVGKREEHHRDRYQVQLPSAVSRIVVSVLDAVHEDGRPRVPDSLVPQFVGALFDDEGHISTDRKAFVSNTDHELLAAVREMLAGLGIDAELAENQHKLYVRGRHDLERFLDRVPLADDWTFYRGLDGLQGYDVTGHKARMLRTMAGEPRTSDEIASVVGLSRGRVNALLRELREGGYVTKHVEESNRSHDGNRTIRYSTDVFDTSVYATLLDEPSSVTVTAASERAYDGPVYDLTVDERAPNFALAGGPVVHNSTRHNTIEKLYDRGYVEGDPPKPTGLAMAVVEAAEQFADHIVDEGMTAQLERDMTAIAEGEATFEEVTEESREMLRELFDQLEGSREAIGEHLRDALKADRTLGLCPESGHDLLIRRSRRGSYFVGCDGFPECQYTLPLPGSGEPTATDERCDTHDLRHVKMLDGRDTYVHGCPLCRADEADETEDRVIGACPECGEQEGGELAIKQLRNGNRLVGCTRYPDCEYSLPLPRRGEVVVTDEHCEEHGLPALEIHDGDGDPWELGCPICNYREFQARQRPDELQDLDGVGEATADRLNDAGVESIDDLRASDPEEVAGQVQGVSAERVREWQEQVGA